MIRVKWNGYPAQVGGNLAFLGPGNHPDTHLNESNLRDREHSPRSRILPRTLYFRSIGRTANPQFREKE